VVDLPTPGPPVRTQRHDAFAAKLIDKRTLIQRYNGNFWYT
jgi:hypothetical protein